MDTFKASDGVIYTGRLLVEAREKVARGYEILGDMAINNPAQYFGDCIKNVADFYPKACHDAWYASAKEMREGTGHYFKYFQDLNTEITGKCVALLP